MKIGPVDISVAELSAAGVISLLAFHFTKEYVSALAKDAWIATRSKPKVALIVFCWVIVVGSFVFATQIFNGDSPATLKDIRNGVMLSMLAVVAGISIPLLQVSNVSNRVSGIVKVLKHLVDFLEKNASHSKPRAQIPK